MKLTLEMSVGSVGKPDTEAAAEALVWAAGRLLMGDTERAIMDVNGNTVGHWGIVSDPDDFDPSTVPVLFNMTLANGSTSARFCYEAASVLGLEIDEDDAAYLAYDHGDDIDRSEAKDEIVQEWTDKLDAAGYCATWNAGDVVVHDLRNLTDDEREAFHDAQQ